MDKNKVSKPKPQPNFDLSGKLAKETNTVNGVTLKYYEPKDAIKKLNQIENKFRLYIFKNSSTLGVIKLYNKSSYLFGKDRSICDIFIENPSCSKQHAVIQHRLVESHTNLSEKQHKMYIIDLESTNGTRVNNQMIPKSRFFELMHKDVINFGFSTRDYIILLE